jgi:hypothetical protein
LVFLCASPVFSACDLPLVAFDLDSSSSTSAAASGGGGPAAGGGGSSTGPQPTTSSGTGAMGGASGSAGSGAGTSSSSSTGGSGGGGPVLQCNFPEVSYCKPGEVCCLDKAPMAPMDHCASPGGCQPESQYGELQCHANADCSDAKLCCLYFVINVMMKLEVQASYCAAACDFGKQEIPACTRDVDCVPYPDTPTCQMVLGTAYPDYQFCYVP